ncbi:MAG: DUF5693 family protein [Armatimonadota bacterium]|nr:DUF5693 family protein [Armatimonadota bacterium]
MLLACLVVGLVAAAVVLAARVRLEARYRAVEIVLDGDDWLTLIRREGRDPMEVLRAARGYGATSIALGDNTLKRLAADGVLSYASGGALAALARQATPAPAVERLLARGALRPDAVYVSGPPETLAFAGGRLRLLLGAGRVQDLGGVLEVSGTPEDLEEIGLGFRPEDARLARAAGLGVVLRPRNYRGLTAERLTALAEAAAATSPEPTLIFALTEVAGYEGLIPEAADAYRRIGARFGRIEVFTARRQQRGEDRFTAAMQPAVIRVFSITPEELATFRPHDVVERFVRAAQERNLRLLYLRPMLATTAGYSPVEVNLQLVRTIAGRLRQAGFAMARARPLEPLGVPAPLVWLVALGAGALCLLVADGLARAMGVDLPASWRWAVLALILMVTAAVGATRLDAAWRQVLALATAVAGATGAVVWALPRPGTRPHWAAAGWGTLLRALAVAVATGVLVAALLSQWGFMMAVSTFLGVKVAHAAPVLLAGLWLAFAGRPGRWPERLREASGWLARPVGVGAALAAIVVGAGAVLLLARTGNVSVPLSGIEQQLRETLEAALGARPRTKEFLIGYPALVLAGLSAAAGWRRLALPLAMVGAIGTAGAVNSFSHIHTPVVYTFWRTANALLLGALAATPPALVLLWITRRTVRS